MKDEQRASITNETMLSMTVGQLNKFIEERNFYDAYQILPEPSLLTYIVPEPELFTHCDDCGTEFNEPSDIEYCGPCYNDRQEFKIPIKKAPEPDGKSADKTPHAEYIELLESEWINCSEREPELYQRIAFVVKSRDKWYDGKVFGGTYQGRLQGEDWIFFQAACPGISWEITHWMPLPAPPKP